MDSDTFVILYGVFTNSGIVRYIGFTHKLVHKLYIHDIFTYMNIRVDCKWENKFFVEINWFCNTIIRDPISFVKFLPSVLQNLIVDLIDW